MKTKHWIVPFAALASAAFFGCSSTDTEDPGGSGPEPSDERRTAIGKADSLSGKCIDQGKSYCGGKSKGNCWCDAACSKFGDCCSDAQASCGSGGPKQCTENADCKAGEYCKSEGCATPGSCTKIPNVACTAVITPYCGCDGKTKYSSSGCVFDRYEHLGECKQEFCGGIAGFQCPSGKICVDDPNDSCDPQNGGADCGGICIPTKQCGGFAGLPCGEGEICVDDPNDSCDPQNGGADCGGVCIPDPGCPPVMCELYCQYGFKKNEKGCEICECNEPAPSNSCKGQCGGPSADKSCYCDELCTKYNDCCSDYESECSGGRTPASGQCVKNGNEACTTDADCVAGGCGGELCHNPAFGGGISTCECAGPGAPVAGCGCVAGKCTWYN